MGLVFTLVCTAMTVASIASPRWISYRPVSFCRTFPLHHHVTDHVCRMANANIRTAFIHAARPRRATASLSLAAPTATKMPPSAICGALLVSS